MTRMYRVQLLKSAERDLERLDRSVATRIVRRINWMAENLGAIKPKQLSGDLSGLNRLREGDYRIIYQVLRQEELVIVHSIGHRRDVYRGR